MNIYELIENQEWSQEYIPSRNYKLTTVDFFKLAIEHKGQKGVAEHLGASTMTVSKWMKAYPELADRKSKTPLHLKLYFFFGIRPCTRCEEVKPLSEFYKDPRTPSGRQPSCKECQNKKQQEKYHSDAEYRAKNLEAASNWRRDNPERMKAAYAKRRAKKIQRKVAWADDKKIKEIYDKCPQGYEVDHIIPLQGKLVSGLHVENNLQYLTIEENRDKWNKYEI